MKISRCNKNYQVLLERCFIIFAHHIHRVESMQRSQIDSFVQEKPPRYTYPDPQTQAGRLQKQTDFLRLVRISPHTVKYSSLITFLSVVHIVLHHELAI